MTREPTHPGEHIAIELEELDLSATQMAEALVMPPHRLTGIIRGRRGVTADTALRLSAFLGAAPEFWMNLQRNYELKTAERGTARRFARPRPDPHVMPSEIEASLSSPSSLRQRDASTAPSLPLR